MNILGISAFYHDSAACLVTDGRIIAAAQEERFTRIKHDPSFPRNAIGYCLKEGKLAGKGIDYVAFYDKPFIKFERLLASYFACAPRGFCSFLKAMPLWIKKKLWVKSLIQEELAYQGKIIFPQHHQSHASSAFFPSPFEEAAILTIDGVGEWTTSSLGIGRRNGIELYKEIHFPHSVGLLYSAFTYYLGFKVNSGEYKMMGLAPYGKARYKDLILSELIDLKPDGSFRLNMSYFNYCVGLTMTNRRFDALFGGSPRQPDSKLTQRHMDIAASIQEVCEEIMIRMAHHAYGITHQKNLCLAGGVALNCVGNGRILREGPFDHIWIQPAAGDAGGALGAALFVWYQYLENKRVVDGIGDAQFGSYLGPEYTDEEIRDFLDSRNIPYEKMNGNDIPEKIADLIACGNVVGWFQGRMEFGPRALGGRSILGDPRSPKMQEVMNRRIKFRESFRPFAPSVLKEEMSEFFDLDQESPYMLLVAPVKQEKRKGLSDEEKSFEGFEQLKVIRSQIPAVTHVDYSARIQSVSGETAPRYYRMIKKFNEKYGCPMVINTSFNVRGEPIVCTPDDAYRCFMRTHMDHLIMGDFLLSKKQQPPENIDIGRREGYELD